MPVYEGIIKELVAVSFRKWTRQPSGRWAGRVSRMEATFSAVNGGDHGLNSPLPSAVARPAPCDCIGHREQEFGSRSVMFVAQYVAAPLGARRFDEPLPVPMDDRIVLLKHQ
jgi:hypothetical protein